jgi:hypothetical protein
MNRASTEMLCKTPLRIHITFGRRVQRALRPMSRDEANYFTVAWRLVGGVGGGGVVLPVPVLPVSAFPCPCVSGCG